MPRQSVEDVEALPVQDTAYELKPLLEILIEPVKDDGLKVLARDSSTTLALRLYLV